MLLKSIVCLIILVMVNLPQSDAAKGDKSDKKGPETKIHKKETESNDDLASKIGQLIAANEKNTQELKV